MNYAFDYYNNLSDKDAADVNICDATGNTTWKSP